MRLIVIQMNYCLQQFLIVSKKLIINGQFLNTFVTYILPIPLHFHIIYMQKEQSLASMLMPRSIKNSKTTLKQGVQTSFYSNLFGIEIKSQGAKLNTIYQYSLSVEPQLPQDSAKLRERIIRSLYHELKKSIGYVCWKGEMLWGRINELKVTTLTSKFKKGDQDFEFQVLVKPVKEITLQNFMSTNPQMSASVCQILNINTKNLLKQKKLIQLSPGNYFDPNTLGNNVSQNTGLNVWRGYKITVAPYNGKFYLQIDPCSRVLRQESFLMTIEKDRKNQSLEQINMNYKDNSVLMKYGNMKIYRIEEIDFKQNPQSKFFNIKEGKDVTYIDYYKTRYGVNIKNVNQPLVKVIGMKQRVSNNENQTKYVYLVPQLLTLTGLSDSQRSNFKVMKSIDEFTKISAHKSIQQSQSLLNKLRNNQNLMFSIKNQPQKLQGFKFRQLSIKLGNNQSINTRNGSIPLRDKILDPFQFRDFIFCYSVGKDADYDQADADYALSQLKEASKSFGIKVIEPYWVQISGRKLSDWTSQLTKHKQKQKDNAFDIVVLFMKPEQQGFYGQLKKYVTLTFNCPSQFVRKRTLSKNQKGVLSCASKILLQMNVKLGHPLWVVPNQHAYWNDKGRRIAVAGIASSKGKKGTNIGIVATTNQQLTNYFCDCKQIKSRDNLSTALFQGLFTDWIKNYFIKNAKTLPTDIIVYREGLNDVQAKTQFESQVQGLLEAIKVVQRNAKIPNYEPRIVYLLVNKRSNSRIYEKEGKGKDQAYVNPAPGSVMFEQLSLEGMKEFHLASVAVREGRCSPVAFKVGYENYNSQLDAIAELTYNQCYCYFNWTGAVRVPATLQYANKLSKQYSDIGDELVTGQKNSDLKNKAFFL